MKPDNVHYLFPNQKKEHPSIEPEQENNDTIEEHVSSLLNQGNTVHFIDIRNRACSFSIDHPVWHYYNTVESFKLFQLNINDDVNDRLQKTRQGTTLKNSVYIIIKYLPEQFDDTIFALLPLASKLNLCFMIDHPRLMQQDVLI